MYLRLNDEFSLVMQSLENPSVQRQSAHFIVVIDRSGSMYRSIRQLISDIKEQVKLIPEGDFLTVGWFSSEGGEYGFPLKGFRVSKADKEDSSPLMQTLDQYDSVVGLTCFSEVLKECEKVISETKTLTPIASLWLMTDGQPVVANRRRELQNIKDSLIRLSKELSSASFVGYSDFYNKELMSDMAQWAGGTLRHASNIGNLAAQLREFIEESERTGRLEITVPPGTKLSYTDSTALYTPVEDWKVYVTPGEGAYTTVFSLVEDYSPSSKERELNPDAFYANCVGDVEKFMRGCYAGASILASKISTIDLATTIMSKVGDKRFIDLMTSAYTVEERGHVSELAVEAINSKKERFVDGQVGEDYLPSPNAFCVLELLDLLRADENARVFPNHPEFSYKRMGPKSIPTEGYPKFYAKVHGAKMTNLTWHSERLNLSLQVNLEGEVDLGHQAEQYDVPRMFPTYEWKNYTVIKDGALWTEKLPVKMSLSTKNAIYERADNPLEFIHKDKEDPELLIIDLTKLPLINKEIAGRALRVGAKTMAELALAECQLGAEMKVCKAKLAELGHKSATSGESLASKYDANQLGFLESKGIHIATGAYRPPSTKPPIEDYYLTTGLQVKVKGWSSLPTLEKVINHPSDKKMTAPTEVMAQSLSKLDALLMASKEDKKVELLQHYLVDLKKRQQTIRAHLQELKFSIILGRKWFSDEDEEVYSVTVEGTTVTFELNSQIKVPV